MLLANLSSIYRKRLAIARIKDQYLLLAGSCSPMLGFMHKASNKILVKANLLQSLVFMYTDYCLLKSGLSSVRRLLFSVSLVSSFIISNSRTTNGNPHNSCMGHIWIKFVLLYFEKGNVFRISLKLQMFVMFDMFDIGSWARPQVETTYFHSGTWNKWARSCISNVASTLDRDYHM